MVGTTLSSTTDLRLIDQIRATITDPARRPARRNYAGDVIDTDFHALAAALAAVVVVGIVADYADHLTAERDALAEDLAWELNATHATADHASGGELR